MSRAPHEHAMPTTRRCLPTLSCFALLMSFTACGDSGGTGGSDSDSAPDSDGETSAATTVTSTGASTEPASTGGSDGGSTGGTTSAGPGTDGSTGDDSTTTIGSSGSVTSETESATTTGEPGAVCGDGVVEGSEACDDGNDQDDDACANDCTRVPCAQQQPDNPVTALSGTLGYLWVPNSGQDSVSKIDTTTGEEVARYRVKGGGPARVSVNLHGDVAVASRYPGAVTKILGDPASCPDVNQNGQVDTSGGPDELLPLGADECVAWTQVIPSPETQAGPHALAWQGGAPDPVTCEFPEPKLWVGWRDDELTAHIQLLDGADGSTLGAAEHPDWSEYWGPYTGVVTAEGDFLANGVDYAPTVLVNADDYSITDLGLPEGSQCMQDVTLDRNGDAWFGDYCNGGVSLYDVEDDEWINIPGEAGEGVLGVAADGEGNIWAAGWQPCRLVQIDVETRTILNEEIEIPGCAYALGVSVDVDGDVWVLDRDNEELYEMDPDTYQIKSVVSGLVEPYAYSGMTGVALMYQHGG